MIVNSYCLLIILYFTIFGNSTRLFDTVIEGDSREAVNCALEKVQTIVGEVSCCDDSNRVSNFFSIIVFLSN